ncbi:hypothetical protein RJ639_005298 [Escallonia herrerae]|uniref:Histone-lysine N-methyltransferase n=1 Tax=Escallonia herrerae TaxID=1293975 RepID=A0AA88VXX9_9ASTE|nr:hypothetical protein RJ639_005298 [Escallonia herrerae]
MDPGTSPDSEVINVISDTQISGKTVEDLHDALTSSQDCVASRDLTSLPQTSSENGKECNKPQQASSENNGHQGKLRDCFCMSEDSAIGNASGTTSGSDGVSMDFQPKSRVNDFGVSIDTSKVESFVEGNQCSSLGVGLESPESQTSEPLRYCNVPKGRKVSKISRSKGMSRSGNACRPDEKQANSVDKHKVNEKDDGSLVVCNVESDPVADIPSLDGCDKTKSRGICSSGNVSKLEMVPNGVGNQYVPPRNAWVCCDDCCKWRRIAAELADSIAETNSRWICKDNMDKVFADCSIPQEKSNADINAELEISDASGEEDARDAHRLNFNSVGQKQSTVPQKSSWKLIRTNLFLHRNRKNQAIDENAVMDGNLLTSSCFYLSDIKGGCRFAGVTWLRWHRKAVEVGEGGSAGSTIVVGSSGDRRRKNKEQSWWKGWWIMVCQCKAPRDGRMGCGEGCLNRMLNIECVKGTCPCGELCSNQQFQKRKYAKLKCFKCGKKGYGLQLQEDLPKGQFLIEYVGEVLDMHAYEARQKEYALNGHKHFYFMTLNGSEVIDACAKGNLGRFINHSCEPNCRTEKWMVNGEVCIGLFAMRDIKKVDSLRTSRSGYFVEKLVLCLSAQSELMVLYLCLGRNCILLPIDMDSGEELTFDYNYVRVFGAAAKKCVCGSSQCRGYIGGDPLNAEVIIQDDSDEEFLEPDMVFEDGDKNLHSIISATISSTGTERQGEENLLNMEEMEKNRRPAGHLKITKEMQASETFLDLKDGIRKSTKKNKPSKKLDASSKVEGLVPCSVQPSETLVQLDDVKSDITSAAQESLNGPLCAVQTRESSSLTTVVSKLPPDTSDVKRKSKYYIVDKHAVAESVPLIKSSLSLPSVKKGKLKNNTVNANKHREVDNKSPAVPYIAKKLVESSNDRFEAVQEKLNELLDAAGGISKRKDASRGYLKLLFLTAASGDNGNGEAIQSNRDLSMILDALLKTKSRTVLVDILNKNGLQMLHNIMKRYRREYKKIPILRKLLKILEYLATREILTLEHIASGPPYPGVERVKVMVGLDVKAYLGSCSNFGLVLGYGQSRNSFRESILTLTEHIDKQVHQIARNFRDRWIPRHLRKNNFMDRDIGRSESHRTLEVDGVNPSVVAITPVGAGMLEGCSTSGSSCVTNEPKVRKRKSRWDQPAEVNPDARSPLSKEPKVDPCLKSFSSPRPDIFQNVDEDAPPGFWPLVQSNASTAATCHESGSDAKCPFEVVMGHQQERYVSRLSVSYGIPLSIVQQFGVPQEELVESWAVAPGMPFLPFPPLPPYPRGKRDPPPANPPTTSLAVKDDSGPSISDQDPTSTTGASPQGVRTAFANNQHNLLQAGVPPNSLGRKYFRQQKWNHSKMPPPWIRKRVCSDPKGSYSSELSVGMGSSGNTFYQHPRHQS